MIPVISTKRMNLILLVLLLIPFLLGMSIDLIAPSLPSMATDLHVSASMTKFLIPIFLLPLAVSAFFGGILSDSLGRRKLLLIGLSLFTLVSLLPVFFPSIYILLITRFLQGIALGQSFSVIRAIFIDLLPPQDLPRRVTWLPTIWGLGPIVGPLIGGYLQYYFGWQACFIFFFIYGLLSLIILLSIVVETHHDRQAFSFATLTTNCRTILSRKVFIGSALMMGISYSLLIVFNTLAPFIIQNVLLKTPVFFGHLACGMGICFLLSTFICRKLFRHYSMENIMCYSTWTFLAIAILSIIASLLYGNNLWVIIIFSLLMFACCGILYPISGSKIASLFPKQISGTSSALNGLFNLLTSTITGFLMSLVYINSTLILCIIYAIIMLICLLSYIWLIHGKK